MRLQLTPHGQLAFQPVPAANANGDSERRVAPGPIDQSPVSLLTAVTALAVLASAVPLTLSATSAFLLFPFLRSGHIHLHCAVFLSLLLALSLGFALTGKNKQPLWLCPQPGHPWECLEDLIQISGERPDIARGFRIPPQCRWSGPARRPAPVAHGAGSSGVAPAPCRPAAPIPPRLT